MKIRLLPVSDGFLPRRQRGASPPDARAYCIEQDLRDWLLASDLLTDDPAQADWDCFLPYWNRLYLNHSGRIPGIQAEIARLVDKDRPTFTVCYYDLFSLHPGLDTLGMVGFVASRSGPFGIDLPLTYPPHGHRSHVQKRWLASFTGRVHATPLRKEMVQRMASVPDVLVTLVDRYLPLHDYLDMLCASYVALAPRGTGGSSFRFYEAMEQGVVPLHIGEPDTRPFHRWLPWPTCSLYVPTVEHAARVLQGDNRDAMLRMGQRAREVWQEHLAPGCWQPLLIKALHWLQETQ